WNSLTLPPHNLSRLHLTPHPDPAVDSSFLLGSAAQCAIGLAGLSAAYLHELRTGVGQDVCVDVRHGVLEFKSEAYYTIDDQLPPGDLFDPLAGTYKTADDNWVRIHTNFPHHRAALLSILSLPPSASTSKTAVASALLQWPSFTFEEEAARRGMVATALRTFEQWDAEEQGRALSGVGPVEVRRVGDAPRREVEVGKGGRPLDGVRVLDLTRVLAGPVCGRTLAAHGADVLHLTSPHLPALPLLDTLTSTGKRTSQLDLTSPSLASLVADADVFLQAYRPGGLEEKGFGVGDVVRMRGGRGVVCAGLRAYGWEGGWRDRRGFDSLVQTAMGFNHAEAQAYAAFRGSGETDTDAELVPRALPMQALDHAAGYLLAFGINAALCKTITEGGSWEVRVSLAAVGNWIRSLGRLTPQLAFGSGAPHLPPRVAPQDEEVAALAVSVYESPSDDEDDEAVPGRRRRRRRMRRMSVLRHAALLGSTPVREGEAPMRLDANAPRWLPQLRS
ncbi:CoA-transferase family III, partial [Trametopsis cervina]